MNLSKMEGFRMNRRSSGSLLLSKAIGGFIQYKAAEGLSPTTLRSYEDHLKLWVEHMGDKPVNWIKTADAQEYFVWLRTEYEPRRFGGDRRALSAKTVRNFYISLCAFFTWASREFDLPSPMKAVPSPKFEEPPIEPFTKEEVEALLKACETSKEVNDPDRRKFTMRRSTAKRDQALIMVLLDTGLRASELCSLKIGDVDLKTGKVQVKHGRLGGAKGGKGRTVFLGKTSRRVLWRYLAERTDGEDADAPLFLVRYDRPMNKTALRLQIVHLGQKAEVKKCHPHRFRHTFAITYLRSGGDVFTLQALLGHSTLDMVKHYARIAEIDVEQAHRRASPADNWRL
jgi:integrase/recombinase XerD